MPSTDRRLELKEKTSMAQNAWQAFVYANGLICLNVKRVKWGFNSIYICIWRNTDNMATVNMNLFINA